jgi:hypothetical protein
MHRDNVKMQLQKQRFREEEFDHIPRGFRPIELNPPAATHLVHPLRKPKARESNW